MKSVNADTADAPPIAADEGLIVGSEAGQKALKTQMNADVAQMNVPHAMCGVRGNGAVFVDIRMSLIYVHLRYICVHLRSQSFSFP